MKCSSCGTTMVLDRTESSSVSRSEWYQCPFCHKIRMTTSKTTATRHEHLVHDSGQDLGHDIVHELSPELRHSLSLDTAYNPELTPDPSSNQPEPSLYPEYEF